MYKKVAQVSGLLMLFAAMVAQAEIVKVSPDEILAYLESHEKVVVQFTSPGKGCKPCTDAYGVFDRFAAKNAGRSNFVRVEWTPYYKVPKDLEKKFRIIAMPTQLCFKNGKKVKAYPGLMIERNERVIERFENTCFK